MEHPVGILTREGIVQRVHDPQVRQAKVGSQRIAIIERLAEMLAGIEEQDRQGRIDIRDHLQEYGRVRAE